MTLLPRRLYSRPYDHERRRTWPTVMAGCVALVMAGVIGWAIGNGRGGESAVRTVTVTTGSPAPGWATPARVIDGIVIGWPHTALGAATAAAAWEHRLGQAEAGLLNGARLIALTTSGPLQAAAPGLDRGFAAAKQAFDHARSGGPVFAHGWTLGYRLHSYSSLEATVELWTLAGVVGSVPVAELGAPGHWGLSWPLTLVTVRWVDDDWKIIDSHAAGELNPAGSDISQPSATAFAERTRSFTVMPSVP